jgi:hypothetical protein
MSSCSPGRIRPGKVCGTGAPAREMQYVKPSPSASTSESTADAADTAPSNPPASPSQNPRTQIPAPPYTPPAPSLSSLPYARQTNTPPARRPEIPARLPDRSPAEFENIFRPDESHAPPALRQRRSAKPHPIATDETRRSFPRPTKSKSRLRLPSPQKTQAAEPLAESTSRTCKSAENARPPDAAPTATSRSNTSHPSVSHCS